MTSLLNKKRPPVFCPGCGHDMVVKALDKALTKLALKGSQIAIVSDIGCSGLFDVFFMTHAFHGLHGRALTYATGLKLAKPELTIIVIMGDGGLGIGGAHVLASCRRNLDINLLVLNNFNYGMTGGQCSATTPIEANTASGFLNQLEPPFDICQVAAAASAPYVQRAMATSKELPEQLAHGLTFPGFTLFDIWGICPGRHTKRNPTNLSQLEQEMKNASPATGSIAANQRAEFGSQYRKLSASTVPPPLPEIAATNVSPTKKRHEVMLLGAAGQRINTAGEILCLAAMSAGLHVAQKSDYPITVLRGHSICEVVVAPDPIGYTGITNPSAILITAPEGIARKSAIFANLTQTTTIIKASNLSIPATDAKVIDVDFKALKLKPVQWALAALAALANQNNIINPEMLRSAIFHRFKKNQLQEAEDILHILEHDEL